MKHPDHTYCPKEEYGETEFERAGKQTLILIDRKAQQYLSFKGQKVIFWCVMDRKMPGFPAGQLWQRSEGKLTKDVRFIQNMHVQ